MSAAQVTADKPCEYCGEHLPAGIDKGTRRIRSHHFKRCEKRPAKSVPPRVDPCKMADLLLRLEDTVEALDGTSVENEALVDDYRTWRASYAAT